MCTWHDYAHLGQQQLARSAQELEALAPDPEPSPGWPAPGEPCSEDAECDRSCYLEGTSWVYETTRTNGWGGDEDVQALCWCDHHGPQAGLPR